MIAILKRCLPKFYQDFVPKILYSIQNVVKINHCHAQTPNYFFVIPTENYVACFTRSSNYYFQFKIGGYF